MMTRVYYAGWPGGARCCGSGHQTVTEAIACRERAHEMPPLINGWFAMNLYAHEGQLDPAARGDELKLTETELKGVQS